MMAKLLYVVNNPDFFVSHRLSIGVEAVNRGYEVYLACPYGEGVTEIESEGIKVHTIPVDRTNHGFLAQLKFLYFIFFLCRRIKPDLCHMITLKTFLVAGVAAKLAAVPQRIGSISGLGYLFISDKWKTKLFRFLLKPVFKWVMADKVTKIIFQNSADLQSMTDYVGINHSSTFMIKGSGVNLNEFRYTAELETEVIPKVVMASRLLIDKGVMEFLEAARKLKKEGLKADFILAGEPDPANPVSINRNVLQSYMDDGSIEWIGNSNDIAALFGRTHLVVLPSYREGFPKVLIEAAACGRAVVTTDVPGCRDAILNEVTGLLVPVKTVEPLVISIKDLCEDHSKRRTMGLKGRERAEKIFSIEQVVEKHMDIYSSSKNECVSSS